MEVHDRLTAVLTAVIDYAEAVIETFALGNLCDSLEALADKSGVFSIDSLSAADVLLGDNKDMNGSLRIEVTEAENIFILENLGAGNFTGCYFAENAVTH